MPTAIARGGPSRAAEIDRGGPAPAPPPHGTSPGRGHHRRRRRRERRGRPQITLVVRDALKRPPAPTVAGPPPRPSMTLASPAARLTVFACPRPLVRAARPPPRPPIAGPVAWGHRPRAV